MAATMRWSRPAGKRHNVERRHALACSMSLSGHRFPLTNGAKDGTLPEGEECHQPLAAARQFPDRRPDAQLEAVDQAHVERFVCRHHRPPAPG